MPSAGMSGTCVLRRPSPEVDLLVARHSLEDIVRSLEPHGKVDLVGRSFGIVKFTMKGVTYDVALPRTDAPRDASAGVKGHKDFVIAADPYLPVEKDLERRDFRANSIAVRLSDGAVIDPFEGRRDIRARLIRVTNPAAFPDDPLRVLRAARFASVLGFRVDRKDLRDGQGRRPLRAERRAGQRGALQDPPGFAEAVGRPGGAVQGRGPREALPRALCADTLHPGRHLPPRDGRVRPSYGLGPYQALRRPGPLAGRRRRPRPAADPRPAPCGPLSRRRQALDDALGVQARPDGRHEQRARHPERARRPEGVRPPQDPLVERRATSRRRSPSSSGPTTGRRSSGRTGTP